MNACSTYKLPQLQYNSIDLQRICMPNTSYATGDDYNYKAVANDLVARITKLSLSHAN